MAPYKVVVASPRQPAELKFDRWFHHRNFPSTKLDLHEERTHWRLAGFPQSVQLVLATYHHHVWMFDEIGKTSYTEHNQNVIR